MKGILPRVGLVVVWGPPKCGKSFWVFDIVMHIAIGRKYRGRRVQQGSVVYLALEGGSGFANRVEAWRQRHFRPGKNSSRAEDQPRARDAINAASLAAAQLAPRARPESDPLVKGRTA